MRELKTIKKTICGESKGEIYAFVDGDTVVDTNWIASIEKIFEDEKIMGACGFTVPFEGTSLVHFSFSLFNAFLRVLAWFSILVTCWGCDLAVRKEVFDKVGGFNPKLRSSDDTDFGLRIQKKFGKHSMIYTQKLKVFTSARKLEKVSHAIPYLWEGGLNIASILFLQKVRAPELKNVR